MNQLPVHAPESPIQGPPQSDDGLAQERALIGKLVAERYQITQLIGLGGMGAVYRAEHVQLRKQVALKVLHQEMTSCSEVVARFEREAVAAGRIRHPNVVKARDFGRLENGSYYLALDFVDGQTLTSVLDEEQRFDLDRALGVGLQVARALEAAHRENIVHRDLKPDNVMLVPLPDGSELVKVLDFGIARVKFDESSSEAGEPLTRTGLVFGTPEYMSPEQAAGQAVDTRGDIYALGLLLYKMLAGRPPFSSEQVNAVLMMQITRAPPDLPRHIPQPVREFVSDLLKKDPAERPPTATLIIERLTMLLDDCGALTKGEGTHAARSGSRSVPSLSSQHTRPSVRATKVSEKLDRSPLGHPVRLLGNHIPLWRLTVLAAVVAALSGGLMGLLAEQPTRLRPLPPAPGAAQAPALLDSASPDAELDSVLEQQIAAAFEGDMDAAQALANRSAEQHGVREWLALGRAYANSEQLSLSVEAYARALDLDARLAKNSALRRDLWKATQSGESAESAARVIAQYLGATGGDMLYRLWVVDKEVTPLTRLAKTLLYEPQLRAQVSLALAFLLDWREAISCDDYLRLIRMAAVRADRRAVTLLKRASWQTDCDPPEESLQAAISAAGQRDPPGVY